MTVSPSDESPRFASALSVETDVKKAVAEVCDSATEKIGGPPDLAVMFISTDRAEMCDQIAADVCDRVGSDRLVGCTGESIVGVGREVEGDPAVSLWLARLPGARVLPIHLNFERTSEGGSILGWPDELVDGWPTDCALLVLGEPFTFPAELLLEQMNDQHPGVAVMGGMASGGSVRTILSFT